VSLNLNKDMDLETNEYMNMKVIKMCDVMLNVWFVIET